MQHKYVKFHLLLYCFIFILKNALIDLSGVMKALTQTVLRSRTFYWFFSFHSSFNEVLSALWFSNYPSSYNIITRFFRCALYTRNFFRLRIFLVFNDLHIQQAPLGLRLDFLFICSVQSKMQNASQKVFWQISSLIYQRREVGRKDST